MNYAVKEIFYTLQGEGRHAGRPAVFCRFTGCNLWSGLERDRANAACNFCDTDFVGVDGIGGGKFHSATSLAGAVEQMWGGGDLGRFVVLTGGEPLLQVTDDLIAALHHRNFEIALETNGTIVVPPGIDWVTVSPKGSTQLRQTTGNELKLVYPQTGVDPARFCGLSFDHFLLQPLDGAAHRESVEAAINYCLRNPQWHLSLQTHKFLGIR